MKLSYLFLLLNIMFLLFTSSKLLKTDQVKQITLGGYFFQTQPYTISIEDIDHRSLAIATKNAKIIRQEEDDMMFRVGEKHTLESKIDIFQNESDTTPMVSIKAFPKEVPITVFIGNHQQSGDYIRFEHLKNIKGIRAEVLNFTLGYGVPIQSFSLIATINNETTIIHNHKGARFTSEQIHLLQQLPNHSPIIFDNIIVKMENGKERHLPPVVFYLKK